MPRLFRQFFVLLMVTATATGCSGVAGSPSATSVPPALPGQAIPTEGLIMEGAGNYEPTPLHEQFIQLAGPVDIEWRVSAEGPQENLFGGTDTPACSFSISFVAWDLGRSTERDVALRPVNWLEGGEKSGTVRYEPPARDAYLPFVRAECEQATFGGEISGFPPPAWTIRISPIG